MLYQVGSRRNSSPTLEVGVFLLKEDKKKKKTGENERKRDNKREKEKIYLKNGK